MNSLESKFDHLIEEVRQAEKRIRKHVLETPLEHSRYLSSVSSGQVYLKLENLQVSGSFKYRGVANCVLALSDEERRTGIITASSGNHAAAFAHFIDQLNLSGTIYLPRTTTSAKLEALARYGTAIKQVGNDCVEAEVQARTAADANGQTYISPYNDPRIVGGQGTIAIELSRQLEAVDTVLAPVGGGGLISGIACYLKATNPSVQIIGCQPVKSAVMYESVKAGKILDIKSLPTLSDGTAGGIEQGSITFDVCRTLVDDFVLLSEDEIREAMLLVIREHHMLIEGASALAVAALVKNKDSFGGRTTVLIISGRKIGLKTLKSILN